MKSKIIYILTALLFFCCKIQAQVEQISIEPAPVDTIKLIKKIKRLEKDSIKAEAKYIKANNAHHKADSLKNVASNQKDSINEKLAKARNLLRPEQQKQQISTNTYNKEKVQNFVQNQMTNPQTDLQNNDQQNEEVISKQNEAKDANSKHEEEENKKIKQMEEDLNTLRQINKKFKTDN